MKNKTSTIGYRFSLTGLLSIITCCALLFGAYSWIINSDDLGTLSDIPAPIAPSVQMIGVNLAALPMACLAMLTTIAVLIAQSNERPVTAIMFFGFVLIAVTVKDSGVLRLLVAMTGASLAMVVETLIRRLPKSQVYSSLLAVGFSLGFYCILVFVAASAAV